MPKKMLIDASHPEETRVVIIDGQRIEDFDFESVSKKPLKGNIYLAKVTRVEPSLQAAFVEYGGNRHGFLAFSEIHPDYYQIPMADRQALIEAERINRSRDDEGDEEERPRRGGGGGGGGRNRGRRSDRGSRNASPPATNQEETQSGEFPAAESSFENNDSERFEGGQEGERGSGTPMESGQPQDGSSEPRDFAPSESVDAEFSDEGRDDFSAEVEREYQPRDETPSHYSDADSDSDERSEERPHYTVSAEGGIPEAISLPADGLIDDENGNVSEIVAEPVVIDTVGGEGEEDDSDDDDGSEERPAHRPSRHRPYKIQEVIKRRQVMLVQVVKEERGNKGAALTSYLSLAGRYCVLMPNTPRGGGISRKITNQNDRRRLKEIAAELEVPEGMGVIIRTAGAARTRQEIRRDYEYLLRLWESVRAMTLESTAPSLIYEEGDIIKRAIRDSFTKDIEEVLVQGREAFENARAFMNMLMPAQSKAVRLYDERVPLFQAHKVESYLDAMFSPRVQLRSGGYIVINSTEALVAVDVNSGRATREHSIEETALKTNLEASEEVARQLRLRDLAGLVVIDYIDMEEGRNNRAVEKRLKDCLRHDRARIQVGRISPFGLLEMSRQRLRAGVVEGSTSPCPHCDGTGAIRSVESMSLRVLRAVEEDGQKFKDRAVTVRVPTDVALYILNQKRYELSLIEARANLTVFVEAKPALLGADYEIVPGVPMNFKPRRLTDNVIGPQTVLSEDAPVDPEFEEAEEGMETEVFAEEPDVTDVETSGEERAAKESRDEEGGGRKRRRRGRGRSREGERDKGRQEGGKGRRPAQARDAQAIPAEGAAPHAIRVDAEADEDGDHSESAVAVRGPEGESEESQEQRRRRRRGRRGGRRHRRERGEGRPEGAASNGAGDVIGEPAMHGESSLAPELPQAEHRPRNRTPRDAEHVVAAERAPREETVRHETHDDRASHTHQEPKTERPSSIASFFGFGTKTAEPAAPEAPRDTGPAKRGGWWKK